MAAPVKVSWQDVLGAMQGSDSSSGGDNSGSLGIEAVNNRILKDYTTNNSPYNAANSVTSASYDDYWGGKDSSYHDRSKSNLEDVFYDTFVNENQKKIDHTKDMNDQIDKMKKLNWGPANGEYYTYDDFENYQDFMDNYDSSRSNDKGLIWFDNAYDNFVDSIRSKEAGIQDSKDILTRIGDAGYDTSGFAGDVTTSDKLINAAASAAANQGSLWQDLSDTAKNQIIQDLLTTYVTEGIDATGGKSGRNSNLLNGEYNALNGDYNNALGQASTYLTLAPDLLTTAVPAGMAIKGARAATAAGKIASNAAKGAKELEGAKNAYNNASNFFNNVRNVSGASRRFAKSGLAKADENLDKANDAMETLTGLVKDNDILQSRLGNYLAKKKFGDEGYNLVESGVKTSSKGGLDAIKDYALNHWYPKDSGLRTASEEVANLLPKGLLKDGTLATALFAENAVNPVTWNTKSKSNDQAAQRNTSYSNAIRQVANNMANPPEGVDVNSLGDSEWEQIQALLPYLTTE